jgi:hypothetical protein
MSHFSTPKINASINMNYHGTNNRMNLPNNSITHIHINYGSHVFILQQTKYTIHELNQKVFYKIYKIIRVIINLGFTRATGRVRRGSAGWRKAGARLRTADVDCVAPATNCGLRWTPATNGNERRHRAVYWRAREMGWAWVGRRRERGSAAFYREQEGEERSLVLHGGFNGDGYQESDGEEKKRFH